MTFVLALAAPSLLAGGRWQVFRPRLALGLWFSAFGVGVAMAGAAFVTSIVAAISAATEPSHSLIATVTACATATTAAQTTRTATKAASSTLKLSNK